MKLRIGRSGQRGQALPLFALMLTAMLAATGLVVDVGGAWAQERSQQKAADAAALAGATAETNGALNPAIKAAALANALANGYAAGEVTVNIPPTTGKYAPGPGKGALLANDCSTPALYPCWVEVQINRPHANYFAGIIGQSSWAVGARGVAVGGIVNGVLSGIAPIMFNELAILAASSPGTPQLYCDPQDNKCFPNNDFPVNDAQFNWTTFCVKGGNCNVSTADAVAIIEGGGIQVTITLGMDLGAHNQGQHTAVCKALLNQYPNGADLPVAINDDNGNLLGFWMWHFDALNTDCNGKDGELLAGWFISTDYIFSANDYPLTIDPGAPAATEGEYVVRLVE
jgi:hypothetical protein